MESSISWRRSRGLVSSLSVVVIQTDVANRTIEETAL